MLPRHSYLPDLASSDFFLFSVLKAHFYIRDFGSNDDVICAVEEALEDQDATFFDRITMFKHYWTNFIDVKVDYIEKLSC